MSPPILAIAIGVAAVCGWTSSTDAQLPSELLSRLDAPALQIRDEATDLLLSRADISLNDIRRTLQDADDLTPEQIDRLRRIAEERYVRRPAVIGIQYTVSNDGVVVGRVVENSPAAGVLRKDDLIRSIDGESIASGRSRVVMPAMLAAKRPGDVIVLEVERAGELMQINLELGDGLAIRGFDELSIIELQRQRRAYWQRQLGGAERETIMIRPARRIVIDTEGADAGLDEPEPIAGDLESQQQALTLQLERLEKQQTTLENTLAQLGENDAPLRDSVVEQLAELRVEIRSLEIQLRAVKKRLGPTGRAEPAERLDPEDPVRRRPPP
ncbi:MAG: PDZ domain-containing protein [Phycisphaerales bacterium]